MKTNKPTSIEIGDLGPVQNMLSRDIHGILLEATWPQT